ncbi:2-deoxy-D-gluconate 3-dehydrogenase [Actinoplanes campanulatus]|uniref:2-deoxy-D-gluconate 3-dehydrogenase n=1 Tax=Actinoplanes campanulatus TaxID=113559 RepID=A0A7W5FK45_9ACTN|nr:SDR family oxidoreductase [Actinoplanes campanulatus]MBB3101185.1 2-deoxy-D-gluconate 3-dehydrogenase [Actinoplanes campanulatus]GGN49833.1 2-deoxy-D-gluconate 3-dehydrogenase [Actinoplanes campanulatus]GID41932.1 2-deoxy-D-gluconate 3-dehydrogenase [Actinoplanes campanulatus]
MVLDSFRLDGRVALVTGGNRGLGRACAEALTAAGASVVAVDSKTLDLRTADLHSYVSELGRLDILVNNAGIIRRAPAAEVTGADWDEVLSVNLDAAFHLSQAAGRVMLAQGHGKIINIASMLSFQGGIRVPAYTASKHAILGLTRALANEWAGRGVNVNAIAPGYMATDNTAELRADPERAPGILDRIPAGRWGTPDDLKGAVVFLASDAARYVHGAVIPVDGGWLAR